MGFSGVKSSLGLLTPKNAPGNPDRHKCLSWVPILTDPVAAFKASVLTCSNTQLKAEPKINASLSSFQGRLWRNLGRAFCAPPILRSFNEPGKLNNCWINPLNSASRFVGKMFSIERKQGAFPGNAPGAGVEQSLFPGSVAWVVQLLVDACRCWGWLGLSHQAPWPGHHGQGDFVPLLLQHWDQF